MQRHGPTLLAFSLDMDHRVVYRRLGWVLCRPSRALFLRSDDGVHRGQRLLLTQTVDREAMTADQHELRMLTVYDKPSDYPEHVVVRPCIVRTGQILHLAMHKLFATVDEARAWIEETHPHMTRIPRHPDDEPQIVEVWL